MAGGLHLNTVLPVAVNLPQMSLADADVEASEMTVV